MLKHLRMLMSILSFMAFTTDPDGDDPADPLVDDKNPAPNDDKLPADKSTWTVDQWEHHTRSVGAKEKAEGKRVAEKAHQDAEAEAKRLAGIERQESDGEYETAKTQLTKDRDDAVQKRDRALELLKANVETQWSELPESVIKAYTGEDDDVLAKSAHMQQMKPIIDELGEKSGTVKGGNHRNPVPVKPGRERAESPITVRDILNS